MTETLVVRELAVRELDPKLGNLGGADGTRLGRLRAAGVVVTQRKGRETVCRLREGAFAEFAARERAILGFVG